MTGEPVFVVTNPQSLYERMDVNFHHPQRTREVKRLRKLEEHGIVKIRPLAELVKSRKKCTDTEPDTVLPCIELADIQRDYGLIDMKYSTVADAGTSTIECRGGDILFSRLRPHLNKVAIIPDSAGQAVCSGEFFVLSKTDKTLPLGYLWLVLRSSSVLNQNVALASGSIRPRIAEEDFDSLLIPILTDADRMREIDLLVTEGIAGYFSAFEDRKEIESNFLTSLLLSRPANPPKLFSSMSSRQPDSPRASYRMDPLFFHPHYYKKLKGMLQKWAKDHKGKVLELQCCAEFISRQTSKAKGTAGPIPRLGSRNVKGTGIRWDCDYVDADTGQADTVLQKNDLLITSTGVGTTCRVDVYTETRPAITDGHITVVRPKPGISPYFMLGYLRTEYGRRQLLRMERGTSGQIEISADDVKRLLTPIPEDEKLIKNAEKETKDLVMAVISAKKTLNKAMHLFDASFTPEIPFDLEKANTTIPKNEWRISGGSGKF